MKTSQKLLLTGTIGALIPLALYASDQVNGMYNFVDLDPILTEEVNENFQHLAGLINSTDNVAHISVDEVTGNVGIGTKVPVNRLHVRDASNFYAAGFSGNGGTNMVGLGTYTGNVPAMQGISEAGVAQPLALQMSGGNVGIGTTSPSAPLHVSSSVTATTSATFQNTSATGYGMIGLKGTGREYRIGTGSLSETSRDVADKFFIFDTKDQVMRMVVTPGGNVGIGTTKPATKLAIAGSDDPSLNSGAERDYAGGGLTFMSTGGFSVAQIGTVQPTDYYYDAGDLVFKTSDGSLDERMRIQGGSGNVGIGTTTPSQRLHVDGNIRVNSSDGIDSHIGFYSGEVEGGFIFYDASEDNMAVRHRDAADNQLTLSGYGNVGIGTTTPAYKLDVNGEIRSSKGVYVAGNISADDYLNNSDLRLKTDITPLENASEGIACLEGVTYRWNDPASSQDLQIGLIAQDVERCFPEVVTTDPKGYKSVSYARLVAPLIENAKEQQALNTSQQLEIARLKADQSAARAELAATNARLAKLEALLSSRR